MSELSHVLVSIAEKYAGSDRLISWSILAGENPVQWLEIKNHPNPEVYLTMQFFTEYEWVEVHLEHEGLYDKRERNEVKIIQMNTEIDWRSEVIRIIEGWLAYEDGKPTRPPPIKD